MKQRNLFFIFQLTFYLSIMLFFSTCKKDDHYNEFGQYNSIVFNPSLSYGSMEDQDGNTYKTIKIGNQTWMAENLKTTKYNDGTTIELVSNNKAWINCSNAYCWFNDDISFKKVYGALYTGYAVLTGKLAPIGWHIPSDQEWDTLRAFAGGQDFAGRNLKEAGVLHWDWSAKYGFTSTNNATNQYGFTALPGGTRSPGDGFCLWALSEGDWWSYNSIDNSISDWLMDTDDSFSGAEWSYYLNLGCSVRCIKDE